MDIHPFVIISTSPMNDDDDISDLDSTTNSSSKDNSNTTTGPSAPNNQDKHEENCDKEEDEFPDFPPTFDRKSKTIPSHLLCSLTKAIMIDPVIDSEGNTFERKAIVRWLELEDVSPVTGNLLSVADLVENKKMMDTIGAFREEVWSHYRQDATENAFSKRDKRQEHPHQQQRTLEKRRKAAKAKQLSSKACEDSFNEKSKNLLAQMQEELDLLQQEQSRQECDVHKTTRLDGSTLQVDKQEQTSDQQDKSHRNDDVNQKEEERHNMTSMVEPEKSSKVLGTACKKNDDRVAKESVVNVSSKEQILQKAKSNLRTSLKGNPEQAGSVTAAVEVNTPTSTEPSPLSPPSHVASEGKSSAVPAPSVSSARKLSSRSTMKVGHSSFVSPTSPLPSLTKRADPLRKSTGSPLDLSKGILGSSNKNVARIQPDKNPINSPLGVNSSKKFATEVDGNTPLNSLHNSFSNNTASTASLSHHSKVIKRDHGWSVPIGVHRVICDLPGLAVTQDIHRKSAPVKYATIANRIRCSIRDDSGGKFREKLREQDLFVPPESYIEVIETQVHGDRVRGRIVWEEDVDISDSHEETKKSAKKRSSLMIGKLKGKEKSTRNKEETPSNIVTHRYTGWVSLRWANAEGPAMSAIEQLKNVQYFGHEERNGKTYTDENSGPWTEPVSLGVYRVSFGHGLPIRTSAERNSELVGMLDRGQYVEVVETVVRGDRVRARCILPPSSRGTLNGWISLFNAVTGASGATAVPLGAYVAVAKSDSIITEGGSQSSKIRGTLSRGTCVEIVATRIEDGVVRGLISTGGHVTLFGCMASQSRKGQKQSSSTPSIEEQFLMHVPIGLYQVIYSEGLPVSMGFEMDTPSGITLAEGTYIQVVETNVENGCVRGRIISVINGSARRELHGWVCLFKLKRRWCRIVTV